METCPVCPRILIADDEMEVRSYVSSVLASYGAEVTAVSDGRSAVEEAVRSRYDLCILDIDMPDMDGLEACRRLRSLSFTQRLPVLFLTGYTDGETIDKAFAAGGSDYLPKPVHPALLWLRAHNLLLLDRLQKQTERLSDALNALPPRPPGAGGGQ